jgi:hypothetical protein
MIKIKKYLAGDDRWNLFMRTWLVHLILPVAFLLLVFLCHPFRETFQNDTDEGINLIKAVLVMDGHQITGDIPSDQPPLLSNLLALTFRWTGRSVNVGRVVVLTFSAFLLGAAGMASQIAWDRGTSFLVYLILVLLPHYFLLSVSVMIGQPSIALAMGALFCIFSWHRYRKWFWLLLAGLLMSLSLFMKIFTLILLPIFGIGLLVSEWAVQAGKLDRSQGVPWVQLLKPAFIFSVSLFVFGAMLAITTLDLGNVLELILPHLEYRTLTSVTGSITADLKSSGFVITLSVFGLGYSLAKRKWLALYPAAWAVCAYLLLLNHNPVWWHHQVLVTIPAAMLAGFGVVSIFRDFWDISKTPELWHKAVIFSGLLIIGALLNQRFPEVVHQLGNRKPSFRSYGLDPESGDMQVLSRMVSLAEEGDLIVTDMPIFAVRAKMHVPLELAWVSDKRFRTGFLTEADFIDLVERYEPRLVLIARYPLQDVRDYLAENPDYDEVITTKIHTQKRATLYTRVEN